MQDRQRAQSPPLALSRQLLGQRHHISVVLAWQVVLVTRQAITEGVDYLQIVEPQRHVFLHAPDDVLHKQQPRPLRSP